MFMFAWVINTRVCCARFVREGELVCLEHLRAFFEKLSQNRCLFTPTLRTRIVACPLIYYGIEMYVRVEGNSSSGGGGTVPWFSAGPNRIAEVGIHPAGPDTRRNLSRQ